jgi:predicted aspartyl protease
MPQLFKGLIKDGVISFYVQVKGPKTFRIIKMAMDTGASYTIIPIETAIAIGYNPALSRKNIEITTASGVVVVPIIKIESITCLGQEVKNLEIICHDLPTQSPVKGLLGLNFLVHFPPFKKFLAEIDKLYS